MASHWDVEDFIRHRIARGSLFVARDLTHIVDGSTLTPLLSRYARIGFIRRAARGVYYKPRRGDYMNRNRPYEPLPDVEEIVRYRAASTGERLQIHGADAARVFGFAERAPERPRFATSGRTRSLRIGTATVDFRRVPDAILSYPFTRAGAALAAIHHLDRAGVVTRVRVFLDAEDADLLRIVMPRLPARVRTAWARAGAIAHDHAARRTPAVACRAMTNRTQRLTAIVTGDVQGVGYRAFVRRHAQDLRLAGTVENLADGRVEVVAEGPRSELDQLLIFLRRGPIHAEVTAIDENWSEGGQLDGFYVY